MRSLRFRYWWLAGGMLLVGFVLYKTLAPATGGLDSINDKVSHLLAFTALMGWFSGVVRPRWFPLLALLLMALGIGIELLQSQLSYRSAEVGDALFDFAGILVAWTLAAAGLGDWAEYFETRLPARSDRSARDA